MNTLINRDTSPFYAQHEELKPEDIRILQEWLKKQAHLPQLTDFQVLMFLHSCYYSIETTKKTIDIYFTRRAHYSHIFHHLNEEDLRKAASVALITILSKRTKENNVILFGKLTVTKAESFDFVKLFKMLEMVATLAVYTELPANGAVVVFDYKGFGLGHITKLNLMALKHMLDHLQEGAPVRIREIHFINALSVMDKVMALAKPFLSSQLFQMVQFHSSLETFYKYVSPECLPEDYGGSLPSCQILQKTNLEVLLNHYDLFIKLDNMRVDESRRIKKYNSFGIEGTFKRLEID